MLLEAIKEQCVRDVQYGTQSSGSRFESEQIEDAIRVERIKLLIEVVTGSRTRAANPYLSPQWYQSILLPVNTTQDTEADFILFDKPRTVTINSHVNGISYFGKEKSAKSFTQVKSWSQAADAMDLGEIYPNGGEHFLDDGDRIVVFGNKGLTKGKLVAILVDPMDDTAFDVYTKDYPVPEDVLSELIMIVKAKLFPAQAGAPAQIQSGNDITSQPNSIIK